MNSRVFRTIASAVLLMTAVACTGGPSAAVPLEDKLAQRGYTLGPQVKKVINLQVSGWNSLDLKNVIVNFGASRDYLVTLRTSCDGVLSASVISFSTTVGYLTDKDKLLVRDGSRRVAQCYISTIHELEKIKKTRADQ